MTTFLKKLKTKLFGRSVQEIFNVVIYNGFYRYNDSVCHPSMCEAIRYAHVFGVITQTEVYKACDAIYSYMKDEKCGYLAISLKDRGLPHSYEDRLDIYKNWKHRPKLK